MYGMHLGDIWDVSWEHPGGIWEDPGGIWVDPQADQAQEGLPERSEVAGLIKVVPLSIRLQL